MRPQAGDVNAVGIADEPEIVPELQMRNTTITAHITVSPIKLGRPKPRSRLR